ADAVAFIAERALAAGFGAAADGNGDAPISGTRAERYQVVLHVEPATLIDPVAPTRHTETVEPTPETAVESGRSELEDGTRVSAETSCHGRSELEDGTRVSAETSRRIACDASIVRVTRAHNGSVLDVGRRTRTIPPALRRALDVRDRG